MKQIGRIVVALVTVATMFVMMSTHGSAHPDNTVDIASFYGDDGPVYGSIRLTHMGGIYEVNMLFSKGFQDPTINNYSFILGGSDFSPLFRQHLRILDSGTVPVSFVTNEPLCNVSAGTVAGEEFVIYHEDKIIGVAPFTAK